MCVSGQDVGLAALRFSRKLLSGMLDATPDGMWCAQPVAGINHPLWLMGHVAWEDDDILVTLTGGASALPDGWKAMFGTGSKPSSSLNDYPPVSEVRRCFDMTRESLLAWYGGLDEATLASPLPDALQGTAESYAALAGTLAWHEGLHAGQLTVARKLMGLPPVFM